MAPRKQTTVSGEQTPNVKVGSVVKWEIMRSSGYRYVTADSVAAAGPTRDRGIELSVFAFANQFQSQDYTVIIDRDGDLAMESGQLKGRPTMVEEVCIRMMPETALDAATVILRHCIAKGLLTEDRVSERLKTDGLVK